MDKNKALEQLESVRPDSEDLMDPEFQEAAALIQTDADLEAVFHQRQNTDRRIGNAMCDVEVPTGLKERLLASVDANSNESTNLAVGSSGLNQVRRISRKTWLTTVSAIALCVVAVIMVMPGSKLSLANIEDNLIPWQHSQIQALPEFGNTFDIAKSPTASLLSADGVIARTWKQAAVYSFKFKGTQCGLIVAPAKSCAANLNPPRTIILKDGYAMDSWTAGGLRCVLVVEKPEYLDAIRSQFEQQTT